MGQLGRVLPTVAGRLAGFGRRERPAIPLRYDLRYAGAANNGIFYTRFLERVIIMQTCESNWEDSENNRRVDLTVTYVADGDTVAVHDITPTRVTFLCPQSQQPLRSIKVHRDKARSALVRQLRQRGYVERLEVELLSQRATMA